MPGDEWQQAANLRSYLGFQYAHPGKKLNFMGTEFAQSSEWNHDSQLEWWLLQFDKHRGMQELVRDLNKLYVNEPLTILPHSDGLMSTMPSTVFLLLCVRIPRLMKRLSQYLTSLRFLMSHIVSACRAQEFTASY